MSDATLPNDPDSTSEPDLSGQQLGDFRLLRRLGRGAMAEVYLAEQGSLHRQIAIKVLKARLATDEKYVRRFQHEAQAAAKLVHANIVQIYDVGRADGIDFIAQEYVQGQNLRELIARQGPIDVKTALIVMRQVTLALLKAAEVGIVHRDIKPENIMISRGGEVKVADFGLARVLDSPGDLNLTQAGVTMGTPLYMSPEQVEGKPVDPRSDLYSFGVTCWHMLAGRPPFSGDSALSVAVQHLKTEPPRLESERPDLAPALARIVHKMMAKKPTDRYGSPREVLRELRLVQVDGVEEGWWDEIGHVEGISFDALPALTDARQRLTMVMQTQAISFRQRRQRTKLLFAAIGVAVVLGALAALINQPRDLLADARAVIPKSETANDQFLVAQLQLVNRETWLKSVESYFPDDRYYVPRAKQELVRLYLQQHREAEALAICEQLVALGKSEKEFFAFGVAGQAIAYTSLGQLDRAAQAMGELFPERKHLDSQMARMMDYPIRANRKAMSQQASQDWDEWQKTLPPPDDGQS
jgi:tRNA A-37 threonylcarbamoyl transferase component Bud32